MYFFLFFCRLTLLLSCQRLLGMSDSFIVKFRSSSTYLTIENLAIQNFVKFSFQSFDFCSVQCIFRPKILFFSSFPMVNISRNIEFESSIMFKLKLGCLLVESILFQALISPYLGNNSSKPTKEQLVSLISFYSKPT